MSGINIDHDKLFCYGCAHSASNYDNRHPFPGEPSGERPCCFCVRNKERDDWKTAVDVLRNTAPKKQKIFREVTREARNKGLDIDYDAYAGRWYDGTPAFKFPMDCYISSDMKEQHAIWFNKRMKEKS